MFDLVFKLDSKGIYQLNEVVCPTSLDAACWRGDSLT